MIRQCIYRPVAQTIKYVNKTRKIVQHQRTQSTISSMFDNNNNNNNINNNNDKSTFNFQLEQQQHRRNYVTLSTMQHKYHMVMQNKRPTYGPISNHRLFLNPHQHYIPLIFNHHYFSTFTKSTNYYDILAVTKDVNDTDVSNIGNDRFNLQQQLTSSIMYIYI